MPNFKKKKGRGEGRDIAIFSRSLRNKKNRSLANNRGNMGLWTKGKGVFLDVGCMKIGCCRLSGMRSFRFGVGVGGRG